MSKRRRRVPGLRVSYDNAVDVLYFAVGAKRNVEGEEVENGIELDYDANDGSPCGVTVFGFRRNGWSGQLPYLSNVIAQHLSVDPASIPSLLQSSLLSQRKELG